MTYKQPCDKFRKELKKFLHDKWGSAKPDLVQMLEKDIEVFFERYHKNKGCFYKDDGK